MAPGPRTSAHESPWPIGPQAAGSANPSGTSTRAGGSFPGARMQGLVSAPANSDTLDNGVMGAAELQAHTTALGIAMNNAAKGVGISGPVPGVGTLPGGMPGEGGGGGAAGFGPPGQPVASPWPASSQFWDLFNQAPLGGMRGFPGAGAQGLSGHNAFLAGAGADDFGGEAGDRRRMDRNNREQRRSKKISDQIRELKLLLEQAGVNVSKGNKSAVLTSAADFIMDLQRRNEQLAAQDGQVKPGGDDGDKGEKVVEMGEASAAGSRRVEGDEVVSMEHADDESRNGDASEGASCPRTSIDYQRIFYSQSIPMAITAVDGRFIDCNWRFEVESGYTKQELLRISLYSLARTDGANIFESVARMLNASDEGSKQCVVKATLNKESDKQRYMKLSTVSEHGASSEVKYFSCALLTSPQDT